MTTTKRVTKMLFLAGALLVVGPARADAPTPEPDALEQGAPAGRRAPTPGKATCPAEARGFRLAPAGTNPEVDRLREQQG